MRKLSREDIAFLTLLIVSLAQLNISLFILNSAPHVVITLKAEAPSLDELTADEAALPLSLIE